MWLSPVLNHLHNTPGNSSPDEETEETERKHLTQCHSTSLGCKWEETLKSYCQARCSKQRKSVTQNPHGPPSSPEKLASTPGGLCTTGLQDRDVSTIAAIISSISTASDFLDSSRWVPKVSFWACWSRGYLIFLDCVPPPQPHSNQPVCTLHKAWRSLLILREKYSFWITFIVSVNPSRSRSVPIPRKPRGSSILPWIYFLILTLQLKIGYFTWGDK